MEAGGGGGGGGAAAAAAAGEREEGGEGVIPGVAGSRAFLTRMGAAVAFDFRDLGGGGGGGGGGACAEGAEAVA